MKKLKRKEPEKDDLHHKIVFLGADDTRYYSYKYLRRVNGLGEFGIGPKSVIDKLFKKYGKLYQRELTESSKIKKDIFKCFQEKKQG